MTAGERQMALYLYNKYGAEDMKGYLETLKIPLEERAREANQKQFYQRGQNGVVGGVEGTLGGAAVGIADSLMTVPRLIDAADGTVNHPLWYTGADYRDYTRLGAHDNIRDSIGGTGGEIAAWVYNALNSTVDSAASIATGKLLGGTDKAVTAVTQLIMSSNAASSDLDMQMQSGADGATAIFHALMVGGIEAATEKYSIEALLKTPRNGLKTILQNAFTEASEETVSSLAGALLDAGTANWGGDKSAVNRRAYQYMKAGMSAEEAKKKAAADIMTETFEKLPAEMLESAAAGAFSGALMSASVVGTEAAARKVSGWANGKSSEAVQTKEESVVSDETARNAVQIGESFGEGTESARLAQEIKARAEAGEKATTAEIGELVAVMNEESKGSAEPLVQALANDFAKQLTERGETGNVQQVARVLAEVSGQAGAMSDEQMNVLASSAQGVSMVKELLGEEWDAPTESRAATSYDSGNGVYEGLESVGENAAIRVRNGDSVETVPLAEAQFGQDGGTLTEAYSAAARLGSVEQANAFLKAVEDSTVPVRTVQRHFKTLWNSGLAARGNGSLSRAAEIAYRAVGQQAADNIIIAAVESQSASAGNIYAATEGAYAPDVGFPTEEQHSGAGLVRDEKAHSSIVNGYELDLIDRYAKRAKVRVVLTSSDSLDGANGKYDAETGTIYIADDAEEGLLSRVFSHELYHHLAKQGNGEMIQDFVMFLLGNTEGYNLEERIVEKQNQYAEHGVELTREEAMEEIVADSVFTVLENEQLLNDLYAEEPALFGKIRNFIRGLIAELKKLAANLTNKEARTMLKQEQANLDALARMFDEAARQAAEDGEQGNDGSEQAFSFRDKNGNEIVLTERDVEQNMRFVAEMKPIVDIQESAFTGGNFLEKGMAYFANNHTAVSDELGEVDVGREGLKHLIASHITKRKAGLLPAVIPCIEQGKIIYAEENHKGMGFDSVTVAAKVRFEGKDYYLGVVVRQKQGTLNNKYYVHDAVVVQEKAASLYYETASERGEGLQPSIASVLSKIGKYNSQNGQHSFRDEEYMTAVDNGDTEIARKMVEEAAREAGYTLHAYHGTGRADRVGTVFRADRATSGPMAYFTDSKNIADHYAKDKKDTSVAYDEEYGDYYKQFRAEMSDGKSVAISDAWRKLNFATQQKIKRNALLLTDDGDGNLIFEDGNKEGLGNLSYEIREARGNVIQALIVSWLEGGQLYGDEGTFLDVLEKTGVTDALKKAGYRDVRYRDPEARYEKTYDVYLKIRNPFVTSDAYSREFLSGLREWWGKQEQKAYVRQSQNAEMWDKNNQTFESWTEKVEDDLADGSTRAWTVIPDFVTDYLKSKGYDGVQDVGGKNGSDGHTVYIPFGSEQIKSADPVVRDDEGNVIPLSERFDESKQDIRWSQRDEIDDDNALLSVREETGNDDPLTKLMRENKDLQKTIDRMNEKLRLDGKRAVIPKAAVYRYAQEIKKQFPATHVSLAMMQRYMSKAYDLLANGDTMDAEAGMEVLSDIAYTILKRSWAYLDDVERPTAHKSPKTVVFADLGG